VSPARTVEEDAMTGRRYLNAGRGRRIALLEERTAELRRKRDEVAACVDEAADASNRGDVAAGTRALKRAVEPARRYRTLRDRPEPTEDEARALLMESFGLSAEEVDAAVVEYSRVLRDE
jgi:hypothetical protein